MVDGQARQAAWHQHPVAHVRGCGVRSSPTRDAGRRLQRTVAGDGLDLRWRWWTASPLYASPPLSLVRTHGRDIDALEAGQDADGPAAPGSLVVIGDLGRCRRALVGMQPRCGRCPDLVLLDQHHPNA